MLRDDWHVKLRYLFAKLARSIVWNQLVLSKLGSILLCHALLLVATNETGWPRFVKHVMTSLLENLQGTIAPLLLCLIFWVGGLDALVICSANHDDQLFCVRCKCLLDWSTQVAVQSVPNVLKVDGVVVLIRRLGFQRMKIYFTKLVLDRIEFYCADFLLRTNITFLLG